MFKMIETGEQAAQGVTRALPFAYGLRERDEKASLKQLLIAAGFVPADISAAEWSSNYGQAIKPMIGYLLNAMVAAEKNAGGDPTDLLSRIVHAKTGQTTRVHRRLVQAHLEAGQMGAGHMTTMSQEQTEAKQRFLQKFLPIDGEMFWRRLEAAGQLEFVPAGERVAYWRLRGMEKPAA